MSEVFDQVEERLMEIESVIIELYDSEQIFNDGDYPDGDINAYTPGLYFFTFSSFLEGQQLLREASDLEVEWLDNYIREFDVIFRHLGSIF